MFCCMRTALRRDEYSLMNWPQKGRPLSEKVLDSVFSSHWAALRMIGQVSFKRDVSMLGISLEMDGMGERSFLRNRVLETLNTESMCGVPIPPSLEGRNF